MLETEEHHLAGTQATEPGRPPSTAEEGKLVSSGTAGPAPSRACGS